MNWISIGSGNGLSPIRRLAITWTSAHLLSIGTNLKCEIRTKIQNFSLKKMSSAKWRPFCPRGDDLRLLVSKMQSCGWRFSVRHHTYCIHIDRVIFCLGHKLATFYYNDVIMGAMVSQITSLMIVYLTVYSDPDQRKHQSSASLAFVWGIHRWPVNSPHKWPITRKCFHLMTASWSWTVTEVYAE